MLNFGKLQFLSCDLYRHVILHLHSTFRVNRPIWRRDIVGGQDFYLHWPVTTFRWQNDRDFSFINEARRSSESSLNFHHANFSVGVDIFRTDGSLSVCQQKLTINVWSCCMFWQSAFWLPVPFCGEVSAFVTVISVALVIWAVRHVRVFSSLSVRPMVLSDRLLDSCMWVCDFW